jgi:RimJ/RimL family protein N-acetyltransferase
MTLYSGQSYSTDQVSIGPPDPKSIRASLETSDVRDSIEHWFEEAQSRADVLYFSIFLGQELIGQIFLHDINAPLRESLVGYHLFSPQMRGQGIGTQALRLLQSYVLRQTELQKLIIITSRDNSASQQLARKCEFQHIGTSREDPVNGMVFEWICWLG